MCFWNKRTKRVNIRGDLVSVHIHVPEGRPVVTTFYLSCSSPATDLDAGKITKPASRRVWHSLQRHNSVDPFWSELEALL